MPARSAEVATVERVEPRAIAQRLDVALQPDAVVEALLGRHRTIERSASSESWATAMQAGGDVFLEKTDDGVILWTRPGFGRWWYSDALHVQVAPSHHGSQIVARWGGHVRNRTMAKKVVISYACLLVILLAMGSTWTFALAWSLLWGAVPALIQWKTRTARASLLSSALYEPLAPYELGRLDVEAADFRRTPQLSS